MLNAESLTMNKVALFILLFIFVCSPIHAQEIFPSLKGTVDISITNGTIKCDFTLTNIPQIKNYVIRINSGMNIRYFKDLQYGLPLYYDIDMRDTLSSGESTAYYLHENIGNKGRYLPKELEVKYTGMYPVVAASTSGYMSQDWRGNIAFNGYSVRADGYQSAWYPVLFDLDKQHRYEKVNYDVTIHCSDCKMLFVNGSRPERAKTWDFVSNIPHELAIYCGNYVATDINNTWILNPDMNKYEQKAFLNTINSYKEYYQKHLYIPFKGNMTFIQTTPTADPATHAFSFVASPAIINVGVGKYGLHGMFDPSQGDGAKKTIAHELAHYYFGTYLRLNTEFGNVIDEGFAEYLSLHAVKNVIGNSNYDDMIKSKLAALKFFKGPPFSRIRKEDDYTVRELYLYYYTPIILIAIEKEIGEKSMWAWISNMLNSKVDYTNYEFFEKAFDEVIIDKTQASEIKNKYFNSDNALQHAIDELHLP
jgi:hypothetical protein